MLARISISWRRLQPPVAAGGVSRPNLEDLGNIEKQDRQNPYSTAVWGNRGNCKKNWNFGFSLYGRWEDLDRWKWVVIDVGVILDTSASHYENFFFDIVGVPPPLLLKEGCYT